MEILYLLGYSLYNYIFNKKTKRNIIKMIEEIICGC